MLRSRFTLAVLLAVACDDAPTAPDLASVPPTIGLTAEAVAAMHALLDDPFVHDVIAQTDQSVQHAMQEVMDRVASGIPQAIRHALTEAQQVLQQANDGETLVSRAAIGLTFEAVQTVLDSALAADETQRHVS